MTNQIIPIVKGIIGQAEVNTVNGRELHEFLEVETRFNDWIVRRIEEYGFVDGQDYVRIDSSNLSNQTGRGGDRRSIDYHLSLDMGKELSMVEKTAKGREARRYFIECERRALGGDQPAGDLPPWKNARFSIPKRIAMFLDATPGDHHNSKIDYELGLTTRNDKLARTKAVKRMAADGLIQHGRWPHEWSATPGVAGRIHSHSDHLRDVRHEASPITDSDLAVRFGQMSAAKATFMDASADVFRSIKRKFEFAPNDYAYPERSEAVQTTYATEAAFYALDRVLDCIESLTKAAAYRQ